jgi:hypothetical protein
MAVGRWLAAALIALPVTHAFAPLVGAPLGAWRYPSSLQWGNGRERAWAAGSQGSRLGDCSALTMILSRTREHAAAAAIGTLLLTFSFAWGGDSSLKDGGQQKMETHRHAVLLAEANDEDYQELLPGTGLLLVGRGCVCVRVSARLCGLLPSYISTHTHRHRIDSPDAKQLPPLPRPG